MLLISHRGNLDGSNISTENTIPQIVKAIGEGFDVEIDVRVINNEWYLGHDHHQYPVRVQFLKEFSDKLWCHAKNVHALERMLDIGLHCFWHQEDNYTLTSKGVVWAYPNYYANKGILVMPNKEFIENIKEPIYGICVDNPLSYI
jgi:hypothetical protein